MQFLLIHWYCILPIAFIIAALFIIRDKPRKKKTDNDNRDMS